MNLHLAKIFNDYLPFLDELVRLKKKGSDILKEMLLALAK